MVGASSMDCNHMNSGQAYSSTNIIRMREVLLLLLLVGTVHSCQPNCSDCSNSFCTACIDGYQLTTDAQCLSDTITGCALYDASSNCLQCQPTFQLSNSACLKEYSGCLQRQIDGSCSLCAPGKTLINDSCVGTLNCQDIGSNCSQCLEGFTLSEGVCVDESAGCMLADQQSGVCVMCSVGYALIGYECITESSILPNCYISNGAGLCLVCKIGYILGSQSRCAIPGNSICQEFDEHGSCLTCAIQELSIVNGSCIDTHCKAGPPGNCQTCEVGYAVTSKGLCRFVDPFCLNSSNDALGRCENCKPGYFINVNGSCTLLPANCLAANIVSYSCIECAGGFTLAANGKCKPPFQISNCLQTNQLTNTCDLCSPSYYSSGSACLKVSSLCNGYDPRSGSCLNCKNGYLNFGGQCVDSNCAKTQGDTCAQCKQNFRPDPLSGLCRFYDANCVSSTSLNCVACATGYYPGLVKCVAYPPFCAQVGSDSACSQCKEGWSMVGGQCVIPITNCQAYAYNNSLSVCTSCVEGYDLVNSLCTYNSNAFVNNVRDPNCQIYNQTTCIECALRYFFLNHTCTPINPNCRNYSSDGNCTDCYPGFGLSSGSCILNSTFKDSNCKTYLNGTCTSCYSGYFLNTISKSCQSSNPLCKTSNSTTGGCLTCFSGYQLMSGTCVAVSKDPNCISFDISGQCVTCSSRFFMKGTLCTPINALCKTYNTTTGACLSCYPGYYLKNGSCLVGTDPSIDVNCKLRDNSGKCLQCYSNYFLASNSTCILANPLCKTLNTTSGACLTCYPGYILNAISCVLSTGSNSDQNCLTLASSGLCSQCYTGFYIVSGLCTKINVLCKTYNSMNGQCLSCYPGYTITSDGKCIVPQSYSLSVQDPYCVQRSSSSCTQCSSGYYPVSGVCQTVNPLCKTFDPASGNCTSCYPGYVPQGGSCAVVQELSIPFCQLISGIACQRCIQGYYTQTPQLCSPVSILCSTYDQNTGNCLSCISGYFLQVGQCIFPSMGFDQNCMNYDVSAYCTSCKPGYYLLNYVCSKIDPFCVSFNYSSLSCSSCGGGKTASGAGCQ